jgi:hypothetical protein
MVLNMFPLISVVPNVTCASVLVFLHDEALLDAGSWISPRSDNDCSMLRHARPFIMPLG